MVEGTTWLQTMTNAPSDTVRLILLDIASTVRKNKSIYMDDKRTPLTGHGHAVHAATCSLGTCKKVQATLKRGPGKTEVTSKSFTNRRPIECEGEPIQYAESHRALGIRDPDKTNSLAQLGDVLGKGRKVTGAIINACIQSEFPMAVLLSSIEIRIYPSGTFGAELTIHHPSADKMLNRFQAWLHRRILRVAAVVPRIVVMRELGVTARLSTKVWRRAVMLKERIEYQPQYNEERRILELSRKEPGSWAAGVEQKLSELPAIKEPAWRNGRQMPPTKQALLRYSKEKVLPILLAKEREDWAQTPKQLSYWLRWDRTSWTVSDMRREPLSIRSLRAWSQLKLQGYLASDDGSSGGPAMPCRACGAYIEETAAHLIKGCPQTRWIVLKAAESWESAGVMPCPAEKCLELLSHGGPSIVTARTAVKLAADLARRAGHRRRVRPKHPRPADATDTTATASQSSASATE
jgi:hypothetical protein